MAFSSRRAFHAVRLALLVSALLTNGCQRGSHPDLVGKPAPDFTVGDSERSVALQDLRGKVVVLNFWATWCPPCVDEMPSLVAMQAKLRGDIIVLAVSLDEDDAAYHRFLKNYNVNLLTVRDPEKHSSRLYGTFVYPETYIIDAKGVLRRKFIGPVDWTKPEIIEYLQKL
jgi:cytochrome c biogenesis protein CcmG, thiol:disulfide interchange protein DsbE